MEFVVGVGLYGCREKPPVPPRPAEILTPLAPVPPRPVQQRPAHIRTPPHVIDGAAAVAIEAAHLECVRREAGVLYSPMGTCPPQNLVIDGGNMVAFNSQVGQAGTGSQLRRSRNNRLVVKSLAQTLTVAGLHDSLCMEKAVHARIGSLNGMTVAVHTIDAGQVTPACGALSMVSDNAGGFDLLESIRRWPLPLSTIGQVGARAIRILQAVHAFGIIHGDVHLRNWVTQVSHNPAWTLKIIDFGRAIPFVDQNGVHLPQSVSSLGALNPALLSPWELQGISPSRRDDMYRLSEMLLLLHHRGPLMSSNANLSPAQWGQLKNRRQVGAPAVLANFHDAMRSLNYQDQPNYERWIAVFQNGR